jgi:hypothetical protein
MCARLEHSWHTQVPVLVPRIETKFLDRDPRGEHRSAAAGLGSTGWLFHDCENRQLARFRHSRPGTTSPLFHSSIAPTSLLAQRSSCTSSVRRTDRTARNAQPSFTTATVLVFVLGPACREQTPFLSAEGGSLVDGKGVMRSARTSSEDGRRPTGYGHFVRRRSDTH